MEIASKKLNLLNVGKEAVKKLHRQETVSHKHTDDGQIGRIQGLQLKIGTC